jgi:glutamine---fructose-6-phosphate transaminase (isomerizing)
MRDNEQQIAESPRWVGGVEPAKELLGKTGVEILELECRQQPGLLHTLLERYAGDPAIQQQLKGFRQIAERPGPVFWIGMGASYSSSFAGSVVLQTAGRLSFSIDAGEWLHYGLPIWKEAALSILLTTSGESAELVELFKTAGDRPLGLICNNKASPCWHLAKNKLPILAGPEYGNATKSYTNATAAAIITAYEILGRPWQQDAEHAAKVFASHLDPIFAMRHDLEGFCRGAANLEVTGRGAAYGAAFMGALCIREMSGLRAAPHTGAGFKHGPNLDIDSTHVAVILAFGHTAALGVKLAEECNRRGGKAVLVSSEDHQRTDNLFPVKIDAVAEPWEAITSLLVPQAITLAMVERTGAKLTPRFQYGVMEQ